MDKDLFGSNIPKPKPKPKLLFDDYDSFVKKFKPKKTTDDCYTPEAVYKVVLDYVGRRVDLTNKKVLRPFYPNGNYQQEIYDVDTVVIDNPPFSILAQIKKFYINNDIPFFIFAPTLTLFASHIGPESYIATGANLVYENGAKINTSFVTNMWQDDLIVVDGDFRSALERACVKEVKHLPRFSYPDNVVSGALLQKISRKGINFIVKRNEAAPIKKLSTQADTAIFGGGFLLNTKAAAEKAAAEKAAAEKAAD